MDVYRKTSTIDIILAYDMELTECLGFSENMNENIQKETKSSKAFECGF